MFFLHSGPAFPPPPLVAGPLKNNLFRGFPKDTIHFWCSLSNSKNKVKNVIFYFIPACRTVGQTGRVHQFAGKKNMGYLFVVQ